MAKQAKAKADESVTETPEDANAAVVAEDTEKPAEDVIGAETSEKDASGDSEISDGQDDDTLSNTGQDDIIDAEPAVVPAAPEVMRETVVERKAGFIPTALGGIVAAGIGFWAAQTYFNDGTDDLQARVVEQTQRIDDLSAKLDAVPVPDLSGVEAGVGDAQAQIAALSDQLNALETQVRDLASRPAAGDSSGGSVDLAPIQSQIDELRAALDLQKGTLSQMIETAETKRADAEEEARLTVARAAVTRILVALENGAAFDDELAEIEANSDAALPEALAQVASTGSPTIGSLSEAYPAAAREALAAARSQDTGGGLGSFLTRQLGARSVTPQEGNDPDAILSRMEAAVKEGRIADALADMEGLPDAAKAPLADWAAQANLRLTVAREAETLATSLNSQ